MVTLYTRTVCPKCMLIKNVLEGAEVNYSTVNLDFDNEAEDMLKDKGFMALPIMEVNGEFIGELKQIQSKISELTQ